MAQNDNAYAILSIVNDPSLWIVDDKSHATPMTGYLANMYRTRANNYILNNSNPALAYNDLLSIRFGPAAAAQLDPTGMYNVIPANLVQSGATRAVDVVEQTPYTPPPAQNQPPGTTFAFGGQTANPLLPNNTPNPTIPGSLNPGAAANAQDVAMGSTQSAGPQRDIWDIVINGPDPAQGAGGNTGGSGIDSKLVLYGLIALVAVAALK